MNFLAKWIFHRHSLHYTLLLLCVSVRSCVARQCNKLTIWNFQTHHSVHVYFLISNGGTLRLCVLICLLRSECVIFKTKFCNLVEASNPLIEKNSPQASLFLQFVNSLKHSHVIRNWRRTEDISTNFRCNFEYSVSVNLAFFPISFK